MKKAYFSKRIQKENLAKEQVDAISQMLVQFNRAKHTAYNVLVCEKRTGKKKIQDSLHIHIKKTFGFNDYVANSAVQEAQASFSSQKELQKMYVENVQEQIVSIKAKIKNVKSRLTVLRKIKKSFVKGKPKFNKTSREQQFGSFFVVQFKNKTDLYYNGYDFEHIYLDAEIKKIAARLGNIEMRLFRKEQRLKELQTKTPSVVFGSKKLFKAQHTVEQYQNDHDVWRKDWESSRYNRMTISGRKDAKHGNFLFTYQLEQRTLHFLTPQGVPIALPDVVFPYGQKEIEHAVTQQLGCKDKKKFGKPMAWSIEDHETYYIVKCLVDLDENPHKNYSKSDGFIGVDCNVDHFAWANINAKGQLIKSGVIRFDIEGKTSGQITKIIEEATIELVNIAVAANKPLAVEKLNTTKTKASQVYGNKKANRRMSLFSYNKMLFSINNRAEKMAVAVVSVNPAFTSQIGKMKYMKQFGISIHQTASFVIARRAMGFKEKLPPVLRSLLPEKMVGSHHWAQWKYVSSCLKDVRTCTYYQSNFFDVPMFQSTSELFVRSALTTDYEQKAVGALNNTR